MFPIRELAELVLKTLPMYFWRPELTMVVGVVLFLVYRQYTRVARMEEQLLGRPKKPPLWRTAEALLYGLGGGLLGTALFLLLGISLNDVGIWYLWPVAILLFLLHPRFICFAYAGGIVSVVHLATGWPHVHVPSMMALVGLLHLVESVLIWWHGAKGATPVIVRRQKGDVVGGFTLQKFWPLPFMALMSFMIAGGIPPEELVSMPDWWPLIATKPEVPEGSQLVHMLFPVVAALGYGDIALTRSPREKARRTALMLLAYSVVLMGLAWLAHHVPFWAWPAALFSPLAHEALIAAGRRAEERGTPRYVAGDRPTILDVLPGSPAEQMGLRPGDRLLEVNGFPVRTKANVQAALWHGRASWQGGWFSGWPGAPGRTFVWDGPGEARPVGSSGGTGVEIVAERPGEPPFIARWPEPVTLGIVFVPEPYDGPVMDLRDRSRYARIVAGLGRFVAKLTARA